MRKSKPRPDFNEMLLAAIDEALSSLGKSVAASVYFHLEKKVNIKSLDIPKKISEFSDALEKIFGVGARTLEILFMEKCYSKVKVRYKWLEHERPSRKGLVPEITFQEHVRLMRQNYEKTREGIS